jgi:hypothetical protein
MDASLLRHRNAAEWLVFLDPDEVHTARVHTAKGAQQSSTAEKQPVNNQ